MSTLYKAAAGAVVKDPIDSPSFLSVDGLDAQLRGGRLIATSLHIDRGQGFQIIKSLSNVNYVYAFGEEPGRIKVGGLLFLVSCRSRSTTARSIADINSYYERNNIYFRRTPVRIATDGTAFATYLTEMSIVLDQNQFNFGSFSLGFTLIPENSGGDESGKGGGLSTGGLTTGGLTTGSL